MTRFLAPKSLALAPKPLALFKSLSVRKILFKPRIRAQGIKPPDHKQAFYLGVR
ncbi:hypothetical protein HDU81_006219, partial [Chytriomyces hyalinus]